MRIRKHPLTPLAAVAAAKAAVEKRVADRNASAAKRAVAAVLALPMMAVRTGRAGGRGGRGDPARRAGAVARRSGPRLPRTDRSISRDRYGDGTGLTTGRDDALIFVAQ